ncbi:MAG: hypothetical protein A2X36_06280 [Elusimicrobia bacterium GWA2_69_24]|nr:MAG: hypothetical protein A2X36_06280 [Elusimicrobia bacterium GWA2_69_24]HBL15783.1 oxidoreductase [Elusimicrobiota bacterium]
MHLILVSAGVILLGGLAALSVRSRRWASLLGAGSAAAGSLIGLVPALRAALGAPPESFGFGWPLPGAALSLELDPLAGFFLAVTLALSAVTAVYGVRYLQSTPGERSLGPAWFCFNLLVASMMLVLLAGNGILFLLGWETMALASFFLVAFESEKASTRDAGWVYLVATHLGGAFLLALFVLFARAAGSFEFEAWMGTTLGASTGSFFILAVIGFGTKAGFMPLHVWLPEAHPAAPSHVSALMSGVMIKTGIYGLLRMSSLLGPPPAWWGGLLIGIGLSSGVLGVLFALAQHDLKRLLAYHSVENIGIIALGLGLGLLGMSSGSCTLAALGFGGGLLHVLNHALFKGLLFLGAGSVLHGTGTRRIDDLGGLLKRMPWTGGAFLVGSAAISGLPPLNGFISELLIFCAAIFCVLHPSSPGIVTAGIAAVAGLALIGGLAAACFAKAFGVVFLGEPRTEAARGAHEAGPAMLIPMGALAASCFLIGALPVTVVRALGPLLNQVSGFPLPDIDRVLAEAAGIMAGVGSVIGIVLAAAAAAAGLRAWLQAGRSRETAETWDCGYARPTARMQYTASSFAQPLISLFSPLLRTRERLHGREGFFPKTADWSTETRDASREMLFEPLFNGARQVLGRMRGFQHGQMQIYVLYVVVTLLLLLAVSLRAAP